MRTAIEGAEDDADAGAQDLLAHSITNCDVVVGITASGRTPYVLGAVQAAQRAGATTVGISNNDGSKLGSLVDIPIEVPVGPEVLAGSTRLKAGSAQKRVLNILTTATMVKLGKTYGNLMVDVSPTNEKLRERAINLVTRITGASEETALETLVAAQWRVKVAATMLTHSISPAEAEQVLAGKDGRLRLALADTK
ncbi:N-acetylmuramic acid 6-phosphate etherase [Flaviflexus ciconiae]|uniref:N-acetylmuramic acid 6-phosphate etherase n=1 Tax=Flaviflexus ciconiae TaxID=2496867 RepID=UPI0019D0ACFB|nr:N-acetylmuramic acid 6-phosphate etherase [Flaviflexus ciconiae]